MCAPGYRDIQSEDIPELDTAEGVRVRVIAGHSQGVAGAVHADATERPTQPLYLDLHFSGEQRLHQPLPPTHNAFVYVYRESLAVLGQAHSTVVPAQRMAVLANEGDGVVLQGQAGTRALLIAGQPLGEPIAQYGPFVMNTREQLMQAVEDFQAGRLGR